MSWRRTLSGHTNLAILTGALVESKWSASLPYRFTYPQKEDSKDPIPGLVAVENNKSLAVAGNRTKFLSHPGNIPPVCQLIYEYYIQTAL